MDGHVLPDTPVHPGPELRRGGCSAAGVALATFSPLCVLGDPAGPGRLLGQASGPGSFTIKGAGFGHGYGMSQYGAYGAARKGLTWKQILAFYYRGTKLTTMAGGTTIRVWVTADHDESLRVRPARASPCATPRVTASRCRPARKYKLVADHPVRIGLPAQLPQQPRRARQRQDQPVGQHLEVLQLGQGRQAGAAQRLDRRVPRLAAAGQAR